MSTDRDKARIKAFTAHHSRNILDLLVQSDFYAEIENALHFRVDHISGQSVRRNSKAHHSTNRRASFHDRYIMAKACKMIGGRETTRTGTHNKDSFAALRCGCLCRPLHFYRPIPKKALDRVNIHRRIKRRAIARTLTRMVTGSPHDRWEGIILHDLFPRSAIIAFFRLIEPALSVLTSGARIVARWKAIDIHRTLGPPRTCMVL